MPNLLNYGKTLRKRQKILEEKQIDSLGMTPGRQMNFEYSVIRFISDYEDVVVESKIQSALCADYSIFLSPRSIKADDYKGFIESNDRFIDSFRK